MRQNYRSRLGRLNRIFTLNERVGYPRTNAFRSACAVGVGLIIIPIRYIQQRDAYTATRFRARAYV